MEDVVEKGRLFGGEKAAGLRSGAVAVVAVKGRLRRKRSGLMAETRSEAATVKIFILTRKIERVKVQKGWKTFGE